MLKNKIIITIALVLLVSGCAEVEVSPGTRSNLLNAPVNETSRAGIVSYSKEAISEEDERQEAYNAMAESCHGAYKILNEEVKRGSGDYVIDKNYAWGLDEDRVYNSFACVK